MRKKCCKIAGCPVQLRKNYGKICDVLIFMEFRYLWRFDVHGKICGVKTHTKIRNN